MIDSMFYFKKYLLPFFIFALFVFGGLGEKFLGEAVLLSIFTGLLGIIFLYKKNKKIKLPPHFTYYFLFLLFFQISFFWTRDIKNTLQYFLLFVSGGFFWILAFNAKIKYKHFFEKFLILLGMFFGAMFLINLVGETGYHESLTLFVSEPTYKNHNHLGDLWAVILVIVSFYLIKKPKNFWYLVLMIIGFYFLAISQSRSAYIALLVGVVYLFKTKGWIVKYKKIFTTLIILGSVLFLYVGSQKSVILSRPYYLQAVMGFLDNPLGIGFGNFGEIYSTYSTKLYNSTVFSYLVHNIVLEMLIGMGLFSVFFVIFLYKAVKDILLNTKTYKFIYGLVFIVLSVNFLGDATYVIPTMLWIWFISLGFFQAL